MKEQSLNKDLKKKKDKIFMWEGLTKIFHQFLNTDLSIRVKDEREALREKRYT